MLNRLLVTTYRKVKSVLRTPKQIRLFVKTKRILQKKDERRKIYYIGIPAHNNLGDLAQGICIRRWIKKHYSDRQIIEIETNALVNTRFSALKHLKKAFDIQNDFVLFQSGYTTTDLGGYADEMHCAVINALPGARILMMPQTIFFEQEERRQNTSRVYNGANMLFLARDRVSYGMAQDMFSNLKLGLFPDVVTTLIGQFEYDAAREGILFCCRDDSEKFYSDAEIAHLMKQCSAFDRVQKTDTTKKVRASKIVNNATSFIFNEIESYAKYRLIITDRYHGTIFSLIAGTPVIIIKTTDHKVTTGAEWFNGIYDEHVFLAESLEDAYMLAEKILQNEPGHKLTPCFEREYYDKLPCLFEESVV